MGEGGAVPPTPGTGYFLIVKSSEKYLRFQTIHLDDKVVDLNFLFFNLAVFRSQRFFFNGHFFLHLLRQLMIRFPLKKRKKNKF